VSAGQSRQVTVGGVRLHVEEHGSGTPVLLIHGWPDSGYLWRHQVPFLASHGFRVIVPDMRGLGRSDRPPEVADYKLANYEQVVAYFQRVAEKELDTAFRTYETKGASLVVMDPTTGDVLALASVPGYNPNDYGEADADSAGAGNQRREI